jgi:hypothetical protein
MLQVRKEKTCHEKRSITKARQNPNRSLDCWKEVEDFKASLKKARDVSYSNLPVVSILILPCRSSLRDIQVWECLASGPSSRTFSAKIDILQIKESVLQKTHFLPTPALSPRVPTHLRSCLGITLNDTNYKGRL